MLNYTCKTCNLAYKGRKLYKEHINVCEKVHEQILSISNTLASTHISSKCPKKCVIHKPIIKWVGGKTQIITTLLEEFPKEIKNYHEIFLGGGSVLLGVLSYIKSGEIRIHGNVFAYDLNEPLIYLYKNIQLYHDDLYHQVETVIREFKECTGDSVNRHAKDIDEAKQSQENYYYWTRKVYNSLTLERQKTIYGSALFLFLNKTCFRGVFRVGPNGFNVPFGHYDNPEILNKKHLDDLQSLIKDVIFEVQDFSSSIVSASEGDFVYLDPPYAPEKEKSFVGYTLNGFNATQHALLFDLCHTSLTRKNVNMMMSNSDVQLTRDAFVSSEYSIVSLSCKRSINSKKPGSKAKEIVVKNY